MATLLKEEDTWLSISRRAKFNAPEMARLLGLSLRQWERIFLGCTGWSPQEWLNHARLWHACKLVLDGLSPKQFCEDLGFKSATGFFHAFKDYHGWTTREYLLQHRRVESGGWQRLKHGRKGVGSLRNPPDCLQHVAALETLIRLLLASERLKFYYLRSDYYRAGLPGGQSPQLG